MKKMLSEFKTFIQRGNVVDMATGIIVGSAFTAIVNSFVNDIISPIIGLVTGGIDLKKLVITLRAADEAKGISALTINYGSFLNAIINFLIIAFVVFSIVKLMNRAKDKLEAKAKKEAAEAAAKAAAEPAPAPEPAADIVLLQEIRDLLKAQKN